MEVNEVTEITELQEIEENAEVQEVIPVTSETMLYRFCLIPNEPMLNSMGLPYLDGTKCTDCTEVFIEGQANYDRVLAEYTEKRALRSYKFFYEENQHVAVVNRGGVIKAGDYIVRSVVPGCFEKAPVQNYCARPYGIAKTDCSFEPKRVPIYLRKKIQKEVQVEVPLTIQKTVRKYNLVKEWKENKENGGGKWIGVIEPSIEYITEQVYKTETIYDHNGAVLDIFQVPATESKIETREEEAVDENGDPIEELVGEKLEYNVQYVSIGGHFEPEYREGLYKMHTIQIDVLNYCF